MRVWPHTFLIVLGEHMCLLSLLPLLSLSLSSSCYAASSSLNFYDEDGRPLGGSITFSGGVFYIRIPANATVVNASVDVGYPLANTSYRIPLDVDGINSGLAACSPDPEGYCLIGFSIDAGATPARMENLTLEWMEASRRASPPVAFVIAAASIMVGGALLLRSSRRRAYAADAESLIVALRRGVLDEKATYYITRTQFLRLAKMIPPRHLPRRKEGNAVVYNPPFDVVLVEVSPDDIKKHGDEVTAISREFGIKKLERR
jgi:hypothetical protein